VSHAWSRSVSIVSQGFDDDRHTTGAVSFIYDFLYGSGSFFETSSSTNGSVNIFIGYIFFFCLINSFRKAWIL
jgi:hypothetical protein